MADLSPNGQGWEKIHPLTQKGNRDSGSGKASLRSVSTIKIVATVSPEAGELAGCTSFN